MPVEISKDDTHRTAESRSARDVNSSKSDALKGATLAFGKPAVKPKPTIGNKPSVGVLNNGSHNNNYNNRPTSAATTAGNDNHNSNNGAALAAATKVGSPARPVSSSASISIPSSWNKTARARAESIGNPPLLKHPGVGSSVTGGNGGGGTVERQHTGQQLRNQHSYLQLPNGGGPPPEPSKSPSLAAALAASRSVPTSPSRINQQQHRPLSPTKMMSPSSYRSPTPIRSRSPERDSSSDRAPDTTSIPPTTALIGMFEKNAGPATTEKPVKKVVRASTVKKPEAPPKPAQPVRPRTPSPPRSRPEIKAPTPVRAVQTAKTKTLLETQKPQPPPARNKPAVDIPKPSKPPTPKPSKPPTPKPERRDDGYESSGDESFVSASDYQPSFRATLQARRLNSPSTASLDSSAMIDSMANAIVASSLASSRAVSPTRPNPPQPPPPRRHLFHNHHSKEPSRTPSPAKPQGLKTTLRKAKPDDEVEENEKRRHRRGLVKKHPNKHHEGDRKRWRDAITERERKRYEAVWASNKGLFPSPELKPEVSAPSVCNLVVRDIYSRSRLNDDVLEEVYNLVDRHVNGRLQKEEFVVGLWLIDQRLKGRKLPPRVSESVWRSAGLLGDIKVKGAKGSRHR